MLPESKGAAFAAWDGELVDQFTRSEVDDEMALFAAHWGIILYQLKSRFEKEKLSLPQMVLLSFDDEQIILAPIDEDYYVCLALPIHTNIEHAQGALEMSLKRIRAEM